MTFFAKFKESLAERSAEAIAASLTVLVVWAAYQLAPAILPAIEEATSKRVLLALLVASLVLNMLFLLVVVVAGRSQPLRVKYGIYWDKHKTPHCPSCKTPLASYANYQMGGPGYWCRPCKGHFRLADSSGNNVDPAQAVSEL